MCVCVFVCVFVCLSFCMLGCACLIHFFLSLFVN